jgi:hypothetical protein
MNFGLDKNVSNEKNKKRFSKLSSLIILGVIAGAIIGVGYFTSSQSSTAVVSAAEPQPTPKGNKKYIATRKIIVDKETKELRKPTQEEVNNLVVELEKLTKRPTENLTTTTLPNGGEAVDLDNGYAGVIISRPNSDGTLETRCVFSFEEAADFLGLEEDLTQ